MQACLAIVPDRRINRQPVFEQKGDDVGSTVLRTPRRSAASICFVVAAG